MVDAKVGGKDNLDPVAQETIGSTAIVTLVCSSHIIVANCGDSRVVLCRGKKPMALSMDHKPTREDECARIEAAGGKVIYCDVLPRTKDDECLILASDGLWDVMTNEEVCDLARKRILLWHKKTSVTLALKRGDGIDPIAQATVKLLSDRALQKGSRDNIIVIVVDLKAQRKFKSKT
ncbi:hypothetical protein M0R45_030239 [Rubus argutus]|uniref:PPM-type phosphatase domain-containing protein n=1 Tax=Rubus argutus TaxID=59490 RepID=A0AAW1WAI1_RUBAR